MTALAAIDRHIATLSGALQANLADLRTAASAETPNVLHIDQLMNAVVRTQGTIQGLTIAKIELELGDREAPSSAQQIIEDAGHGWAEEAEHA